MNELNPCPFCGKIPNAEYIEDVMYVICSNDLCGMSCIASVTLKEWNNRPIEDALQKRIVDLESLLRWRPVSEKPTATKVYEVKVMVHHQEKVSFRLDYYDCQLDLWQDYQPDRMIGWRPIPELEEKDEQ